MKLTAHTNRGAPTTELESGTMWKAAATTLCAALLGACATCERHPVMCGVATAIVAGSIASASAGGSPRAFNTCPAQHTAVLCR